MDPGHVVSGTRGPSRDNTHWQSQPLWDLSPYSLCLGFSWNNEVVLVGFTGDETQSLLHRKQMPKTEPEKVASMQGPGGSKRGAT